jgi:hypothetical protein
MWVVGLESVEMEQRITVQRLCRTGRAVFTAALVTHSYNTLLCGIGKQSREAPKKRGRTWTILQVSRMRHCYPIGDAMPQGAQMPDGHVGSKSRLCKKTSHVRRRMLFPSQCSVAGKLGRKLHERMLANRAHLFLLVSNRAVLCNEQWLRAASADERDLPQGDQRLPLRVGRRNLRRPPLRRQHSQGQPRLSPRYHPVRAVS